MGIYFLKNTKIFESARYYHCFRALLISINLINDLAQEEILAAMYSFIFLTGVKFFL